MHNSTVMQKSQPKYMHVSLYIASFSDRHEINQHTFYLQLFIWQCTVMINEIVVHVCINVKTNIQAQLKVRIGHSNKLKQL